MRTNSVLAFLLAVFGSSLPGACAPRDAATRAEAPSASSPAQPRSVETAPSRALTDRLAWWREARFGMFIHFGVYAVAGGKWGDRTDYGEWLRQEARIPVGEYEKLAERFNPAQFDARAIARAARAAGMRYIVITTKHHDGFCLFKTATTDWSVERTPFKRDIMKEMAEACRAEGLKLGWYYSIMDWHHPDYVPRRDWETDRSADGADFERYVAYMKAQLRELLTNYGEIGVLWFDGQWERTWTDERGRDLEAFVRGLQPGIIINSRVGHGGGMSHGVDGRHLGDYATPEQYIPETPPAGDWETCMTMNNHWGYCEADRAYKSSTDLVGKLAEIASKGGNFLLNVGPTGTGRIPEESIERLRDIGAWMDRHAAAIRGTERGPFPAGFPWGVCTRAPSTPDVPADTTRLFLHVFAAKEDRASVGGRIEVTGLYSRVRHAQLFLGGRELEAVNTDDGVAVNAGTLDTSSGAAVIVLDVVGEPRIGLPPRLESRDEIFVGSGAVQIAAPRAGIEVRYTLDGSTPTGASALASGPLTLRETTTIAAACFERGRSGAAAKRISPVTRATLTRVEPAPGRAAGSGRPGLRCSIVEFADDLAALRDVRDWPAPTRVSERIDLGARPRAERFALAFEGDVRVASPGLYRFHLGSDDGSRLWVNGRLVVDNDRPHVFEEQSGVAALGPGLHAMRVEYFQNRGSADLKVLWSGPDFERRELESGELWHEP
ncbi:MAG: alpha-L-fucosidase [Phycisphaerales bacterium]